MFRIKNLLSFFRCADTHVGNVTMLEKCLNHFEEWSLIPAYDCNKSCKACNMPIIKKTCKKSPETKSVCKYCAEGQKKCAKICIEGKHECCKCDEAGGVEKCRNVKLWM